MFLNKTRFSLPQKGKIVILTTFRRALLAILRPAITQVNRVGRGALQKRLKNGGNAAQGGPLAIK